jgi:TonB family protein
MYRLFTFVAVFGTSIISVRAELRLECEVNGERLPVVAVERHQAFCDRGGQRVAIPPETSFVIDGDLRANVAQALWSPAYAIRRAAVPDYLQSNAKKPFVGHVTLSHALKASGKTIDPFLRRWPGGTTSPSLVVLAWVVDGHVTQVFGRTVPEATGGTSFAVVHDFPLSGDEARGEPIVLLWNKGHFVPPLPRFSDGAQQRCFNDVVFDDAADLRAALAAGADPNAIDAGKVPLVQFAAEAGASRCLAVLLTAGAKINRAAPEGSPLSWAVEKVRAEVVDRLLAAGANPNRHGAGESPLQEAIAGGAEEIALKLLHAGADPDFVNRYKAPPVVTAISAGMAQLTAELLRKTDIVDLRSDQSRRVLVTQAKLGHAAMVRLLLDHGVSPNSDDGGLTVLTAGAMSGDPEIARLLLARKVDPNRTGAKGITALMMTTGKDFADYARLLLDAGAKTELRLTTGSTALHLAAGCNAVNTARLLVERGADVASRAGDATPLDVALATYARDVADVLANAGARIDLHRHGADLEVERAVVLDLAPLVQSALEDGWSANAKFGRWPALVVARLCGSNRCADILEKAGAKIAPDDPAVITDSGVDRRVRPMHIVPPRDPRSQADSFPASTVVIDAIVDSDGAVRFPRVIQFDDFSLVRPALDAFEGWKFTPATFAGKAVPITIRIPIVFDSSTQVWHEAWEVDVRPVPTERVPPEYPYSLRAAGITGNVLVRFLVNSKGHTERVHVTSSSGPQFDEAAVTAVKKWLFKPGILDGQPVDTWTEVPIVFTLD